MKKPGKYLKFYYECMEQKFMPDIGLCRSIGSRRLYLFNPTQEDFYNLSKEGLATVCWGSGLNLLRSGDRRRQRGFTPLRQTIVLFLAAMNNEL